MKLPKDTESILKKTIEELERGRQTIGHKQFERRPNLNEIPEGGFIIGEDGGIKFIYTKIKGARFKATLTSDP